MILVLVLISLFVSCGAKKKDIHKEDSIIIYSASGFRPALERILRQFSEYKGISVDVNYASSGILARQIVNGAECDLFISANKQWIDYLLNNDVLDKESINVIAGNSLVAIAAKGSELRFPVFDSKYNISGTDYDKIAIGNPDFVPAGKYSKMVFDSLNWYMHLANKLIMCKDVSSVRYYVELGECDWGIVYRTEAIQSKKVAIVAEIPQEYHLPINFYLGGLNQIQSEGMKSLIEFINSDYSKQILINNGFTIYGSEHH